MTCPHCTTYAQRVAALEREVAMQATDYGNLEVERKKQRRSEVQLRRQLADALGETDAARHAHVILQRYNATFGRRLKWIPDGVNARIIARAIRCYDSPEEGVQACLEAIDGLSCKPYVVKRNGAARRSPTGTERQRYDELHHCLGGDAKGQVDERDINRFRQYAREAREESLGIPKWGPTVAKHELDAAVAEIARLRTAVALLQEFAVLESRYVEHLEQLTGVRLQDTLLEVAA